MQCNVVTQVEHSLGQQKPTVYFGMLHRSDPYQHAHLKRQPSLQATLSPCLQETGCQGRVHGYSSLQSITTCQEPQKRWINICCKCVFCGTKINPNNALHALLLGLHTVRLFIIMIRNVYNVKCMVFMKNHCVHYMHIVQTLCIMQCPIYL